MTNKETTNLIDTENSNIVDETIANDIKIEDKKIGRNNDNTTVSEIKDYLDSSILDVKEYTYDEIELINPGEMVNKKDITLYDSQLADVSERQVVTGTVVSVYDKEVIVDIGFKSEGIIDKSEFDKIPEIGEEVSVFLVVFEDRKGRLILSKKRADFERRWSELRDAAENDTILSGKTIKIIKGGLVVDLGVVNAFLPGSQVDIKPVSNFEDYLNKKFEFKIVKFNEFRQNVVISRKATMKNDLDESKKELLKNLEIGSELEGTVKNITDFGAFIDLGGIDGLLHITDITWGRINHPSEKINLGSTITVKVIDYDKEKNRISLGLKQLNKDPWDAAEKKYSENSKISGKIVNMMNYGAFVEIEEGIEGLIHISEISWTKHIKHPTDIYKVGDVVEARVLSIDVKSKKLSLGVKQLEDNPWLDIEKTLKVNDKCKGIVSNITPNGAYVSLENELEGFLHVNDISWTRKIRKASDIINKDDDLELMILDVSSKDKKISLGLKQLEEDPWNSMDEKVNIGDSITGTVLHILEKGIIFLLDNGFEGILPLSKINNKQKDLLVINKEFSLTVNQINKENRKIVLDCIFSKDDNESNDSDDNIENKEDN